MDPLYDHIVKFFTDHLDYLTKVGWGIVRIIILIIVIKIAMSVLKKIITRVLHNQEKMDARRRDTLISILSNLVRIVLYAILLLTVLPFFGIKIGGMLAGAGVAGIAIAFGAQSLLKDFFNGFFILFEEQFDVGDFVVINDNWGEIYALSLRLTELRVWTGELIYIPNGEINQVINYSKENTIAVIDIEVGYKTHSDKAFALINDVMENLREEEEDLVGYIENWGVQSLNASTYTVRTAAECNPNTHWGIQRLAKERINAEFHRQNVDFPMQKVVYMHDQEQDTPVSDRLPDQ